MHKALTDLQLKKETAYKVETVLFKTGFAFWFDKVKFATQSVTVTLDSSKFKDSYMVLTSYTYQKNTILAT